ncbi:cobalamin-dependent protein [Candidatus Solincola tengchongensis]|uniref:cobalamin-dependent protein n=1 Tax=Candidatus Solincola tengchongensis TaxID=2900693 RepID=UPI00257E91EF|nr:cobalamin-dependent protein [Candidatus Solincola tengchongensis]
MGDYLAKVTMAMAELDPEVDMATLVGEALAAGEKAADLLRAMSEGMVEVGRRFEAGEYYLADLVLAGEEMKEGLRVLEPHLEVGETGKRGTVVLCTVRGDIHDIGKNLVGTMLRSAGFRVVDLGVDVPAEKVVEAVKSESAFAVGLSVLLTTMTGSIGEVVEALRGAGLREGVKVAIGGACTTPEMVGRYGVDALGRDAVEAVRIFSGWAT